MMKRIASLFCMVALLLVVGCSDNKEPHAAVASPTPPGGRVAAPIFRSLTPREARKMIEQRRDLLVIDLRQPRELRQGYIAGSRLVPVGELVQGRMTLPADRPLLLVCAVGGRSFAVGRYFSGKGYPEIYNLAGGIDAWKKAGLPVQYR